MIAIVYSIYSLSVHAPARDAGLMDNDAERYCTTLIVVSIIIYVDRLYCITRDNQTNYYSTIELIQLLIFHRLMFLIMFHLANSR